MTDYPFKGDTPVITKPERVLIASAHDADSFLNRYPVGTVYSQVGKFTRVDVRVTHRNTLGVWGNKIQPIEGIIRLPSAERCVELQVVNA
jgi:hypothetical protein